MFVAATSLGWVAVRAVEEDGAAGEGDRSIGNLVVAASAIPTSAILKILRRVIKDSKQNDDKVYKRFPTSFGLGLKKTLYIVWSTPPVE